MEIQFEKVDLGTGAHALIGMVEGAVDTQTVRDVEKLVMGKFEEGNPYILLDFANVKYINSTGMGTMVKLGDLIREKGGDLCLINVNPKVKELFNMLGLLAVIKTYDSKDEGLSYLTGLSIESSDAEPEHAAPATSPAPSGITSAEPDEEPEMVLEDKPKPVSAGSPEEKAPSVKDTSSTSAPQEADESLSTPSSPGKASFIPLPEEKIKRDLDGLNLDIEVKNLSDGGAALVITIHGAIDTRTIGAFEKEIMAWEAKGAKRFILDFANVKYINSTGMGTMVKLGDLIREKGGDLFVAKLSTKIKELFDMLGLLAVIKTVETVEEGIAKALEMSSGAGAPQTETSAEKAAPPSEAPPVSSPAPSSKVEAASPSKPLAPSAPPQPTVSSPSSPAPSEEKSELSTSPAPAKTPSSVTLPPPPTEEPKQVKKAGGAVGVVFTPSTRDLLQGYKALFVNIEGALDAATVKAFEEVIMGYANQGYLFQILDFGNVKYINSTGMGTLVKLGDMLREKGGDLHLVNVDNKMKELFNMLGLLPVIEIVEKEDDSLKRFREMVASAVGVTLEEEAPQAAPPKEEKPVEKDEAKPMETVETSPPSHLPPPPPSMVSSAVQASSPQDEMSIEKKRMELIQQGNRLEREGKYEEAISKWEEALELTEFKEGLLKKIEKAKAKLSQKEAPPATSPLPGQAPQEDDGLTQRVGQLSEESASGEGTPDFHEAPTLIGETKAPPPSGASLPDFNEAPTLVGKPGSPLPPPPPTANIDFNEAPTLVGKPGSPLPPPPTAAPIASRPPSSPSLPRPPVPSQPGGVKKISQADVSTPLIMEEEYSEEDERDPRVSLLVNILFIFTFLYFLGALVFGAYFYMQYMR
ncbi:MAG: STAS domain-containing protein [Planctomycetota bacterium]|nr:MAG: STAS domain-containing protein [Planctomycetota bacterium]